VGLAALGGFLLTLRTAAPESLNGSLAIGWLLTLSGLALVILALRQGLRVSPQVGRVLLAGVLAVGAAGGAIALSQAARTLTADTAVVACRDDVAVASAVGGRQLRDGHNPYQSYDAVVELVRCGNDQVGTVLRQGRFADRSLMPSDEEIRAAFADAVRDPSRPEIARRLDYPAGAVLAGVAGERALLLLVVLTLAAAVCVVVRRARPSLRAVTLLGLLGQIGAWTAIGNGHPDGIATGLAVIAWSAPGSALSALLLGLACGTKQTVWFLVPALVGTAAARGGPRAALRCAALVAAGFAVLNAGFVIASPQAWLDGVLGPARYGLFPLGAGLIGLVTSGVLSSALVPVFTALMYATALGAGLLGWRLDARLRGIGAVVAVMALWVGPRSLLEYMAGAGLLAVTVCALGAARQQGADEPTSVPTGPEPLTVPAGAR
jgi:hypothetical protein